MIRPRLVSPTADPLAERFGARVEYEPNSGCWLWTGPPDIGGYGNMNVRGKKLKAHRISWELARGSIPDGLKVLHRCDTPACVNPDHLFLGTQRDNVDDMYAKGRSAFQRHHGWREYMIERAKANRPDRRGEKNPISILTESAVLDMRRRHKEGESFSSIAADYRVAYITARKAIRGLTWSHLP